MILLHDLHDASQRDKISMLARAGIDYDEIADIVGTTSQVVQQSVYETKRDGKMRPPKSKAKAGRRRK